MAAALLAVGCGDRSSAPGAPPEAAAPSATASVAVSSSAPAPSASVPAPPATAPPATRTARLVELDQPMTLHPRTRHTWRQVALGAKKDKGFQVSWQPFDPTPAELPPEPGATAGRCGEGMIEIAGKHLVAPSGRDDDDAVLTAQNETCTEWRSPNHDAEGLCARFDREKWEAKRATLGRRDLAFCIDRYEYPNRRGEYPVVVATYAESQAACAAEGKRLCTETEWTFACEGEEGLPFPYGYERDPTKCNFERKVPLDIAKDFAPRMLPSTASALDRAFEGLRSGERPACASPFGVMDTTGNVDEWTTTVRKYGYRMILKGGHSGFVRSRCRPATRGHGPLYVNHSQGFRCCKD